MNVERKKSPSYPSFGLAKAIDFAKKIYDAILDRKTDSNTILQLMGYQGKSGASLTVLSSLRQYGLISGRAQDVGLSDTAVSILQPLDNEEFLKAIKQAAKNPDIFQEIRSQFRGILPDDKVIVAYLVRQHKFTQNAAESLITSMRETEDFLSKHPNFQETIDDKEFDESSFQNSEDKCPPISKNVKEEKDELISFPLSQSLSVKLSFSGTIDQKAIDQLIKHLELIKESYPK